MQGMPIYIHCLDTGLCFLPCNNGILNIFVCGLPGLKVVKNSVQDFFSPAFLLPGEAREKKLFFLLSFFFALRRRKKCTLEQNICHQFRRLILSSFLSSLTLPNNFKTTVMYVRLCTHNCTVLYNAVYGNV